MLSQLYLYFKKRQGNHIFNLFISKNFLIQCYYEKRIRNTLATYTIFRAKDCRNQLHLISARNAKRVPEELLLVLFHLFIFITKTDRKLI